MLLSRSLCSSKLMTGIKINHWALTLIHLKDSEGVTPLKTKVKKADLKERSVTVDLQQSQKKTSSFSTEKISNRVCVAPAITMYDLPLVT